ncbi:MAG: lipocalin family protein [Capnocytophaga sp.]|nr:lipocalin family protein [Capnocytophaga sp.]
MKKILPLAFIAVTVVLASCSKDDNNNIYVDNLQGSWGLTEDYEGTTVENVEPLELTDCEKQSTLIFQGNTMTSRVFGEGNNGACEEDTFTVTFSATETTLTFTMGSIKWSVDYQLSGDTLTLIETDHELDPPVSKLVYTKK